MKIALNSSNLCRMARAAGWKGRRRLRSKTIDRGSKMTVTQAQHLPKSRRAMPLRASMVGLVAGLVSAFGAVHAQQPVPTASDFAVAQSAAPVAVDPAKQVAGGLAVSSIDFKRGDGGSGKLIMRFSGDGAVPDMRKQGSDVVINVGNASISPALQRPLNVTDFATPVPPIDASASGAGSQIVLSTDGPFETMAYQTGRDYIVEIVPRAAAPTRAVGAPQSGAGTVADPLEPRYTGKPVTFDFQNIAVRTVLKLIADESDLNIVASRSEEHTSELQSLMLTSYAVFCLKKKK